MYNLCSHRLILNFFIKNIKTLIFLKKNYRLTRVNLYNLEPDLLTEPVSGSSLITMIKCENDF